MSKDIPQGGPVQWGWISGIITANRLVRKALGFPDNRIAEGDLLLVTVNDYDAACSEGSGTEEIFNGERCEVVHAGGDFIDVEFPTTSDGISRHVRLILNEGGDDAYDSLPDGVDFGYGMSTHKAQGSQFKHVIIVAERGYTKGIVQRSNIYTGVSRAIDHVTIVGPLDDFISAVKQDDVRRQTLLIDLLKKGSK